jgi:hypothetical protein
LADELIFNGGANNPNSKNASFGIYPSKLRSNDHNLRSKSKPRYKRRHGKIDKNSVSHAAAIISKFGAARWYRSRKWAKIRLRIDASAPHKRHAKASARSSESKDTRGMRTVHAQTADKGRDESTKHTVLKKCRMKIR